MEVITGVIQRLMEYAQSIEIWDVLDILTIAFLAYQLIKLVQKTNSSRIIKGVALVLVALWLSAGRLRTLNYLLTHVVDIGILALLILFQPELRRVLEKMGSSRLSFAKIFSRQQVDRQTLERTIAETVSACSDMSKSRTGALIVFERELNLDEQARSGTRLDAEVSTELLKNIFFVKAPMHDGAAIVRNGRLYAAGCMLPLSRNVNLSRDLGMRHRAGIGMSENSDAVVVLVSEETGSISIAVGGMLKRHLMMETLEQVLRNELLPEEEKLDSVDKKKPAWMNSKPKNKKDGGSKDE